MQMTGIKDRLYGSDKPSDFSCLNKSIAAAMFAFSHPFTIFMTSIPSKGVSGCYGKGDIDVILSL